MPVNRNTLIFSFLIITALIITVMIMKPNTDDPPKNIEQFVQISEVLVYFNKNKGGDVVTDVVSRPIPEESSEEALLNYALKELLKGPSSEEMDFGYFTEIPKGTTLVAVKSTPGGYRINLSEEFTSGGGSNSMLMRLQELNKTVMSLPLKQSVYLDVAGKPLEILGGEGLLVKQPITDDPDIRQ